MKLCKKYNNEKIETRSKSKRNKKSSTTDLFGYSALDNLSKNIKLING